MSIPSKPKRIVDYFILVYKPRHSRAVANGYVPEQILIAEKVLGRDLSPDEDVRHINGNTQDNRPENLEIISTNIDFRVIGLTEFRENVDRKAISKTFMPCRFQKPCWKEVRAPKARKYKVYLPYICSYQTEGDVYKCQIFFDYLDKTLAEESSARE